FVAIPRPPTRGPVLRHVTHRVVLPLRLANPLNRCPHRASVAIEETTKPVPATGVGDVRRGVPEYRPDHRHRAHLQLADSDVRDCTYDYCGDCGAVQLDLRVTELDRKRLRNGPAVRVSERKQRVG